MYAGYEAKQSQSYRVYICRYACLSGMSVCMLLVTGPDQTWHTDSI